MPKFPVTNCWRSLL